MYQYAHNPFISACPVHALPAPLFSVYQEVKELSQAPDGIILPAILAELSLATQNHIDVQRTAKLSGNCSLFFAVVADSGERKSFVQKLISRGTIKFQKEMKERAEKRESSYKTELVIWKARMRALQKKIEESIEELGNADYLKEELEALVASKPNPARKFRTLINDGTTAAIKNALKDEYSSIGIFSDEARSLTSAGLFRHPDFLNMLWSGDDIEVDRISTGNTSIRSPRATLFAMFQPAIFYDLYSKEDGAAKETGLTARCLMSHPESTQGTRFNTSENIETPALNEFTEKMYEFQLRQIEKIESGSFRRRLVPFSKDGQYKWQQIAHDIEFNLRLLGRFADIKDFGAKLAENIARMAALFEHYINPECEYISLESIDRAQQICFWFADEYKKIFGGPSQYQIDQDANTLYRWLDDRCQATGKVTYEKTYIERNVTNHIRPVRRLDPAMGVLQARGHLNITKPVNTLMVTFTPPRATLSPCFIAEALPSPTRF